MSLESDAPMRTICPSCEKYVDTEGFGIPAYALDENRVVYHAKCRPDLCTHERSCVMDWEASDSDTVFYRMKCRDCGEYWVDEVIGSLVRAGEMDA